MVRPPIFVVSVGQSRDPPKSIRAATSLWLPGALFCILSSSPAWGQSTPSDSNVPPARQAQVGEGAIALPAVNVTGYADPVQKSDLSNDPAANPASVTVLKLPEEKARNNRDYVDVLKPIMGVAANNFDQGGIGFGFTMRGFSERSNGGGVLIPLTASP